MTSRISVQGKRRSIVQHPRLGNKGWEVKFSTRQHSLLFIIGGLCRFKTCVSLKLPQRFTRQTPVGQTESDSARAFIPLDFLWLHCSIGDMFDVILWLISREGSSDYWINVQALIDAQSCAHLTQQWVEPRSFISLCDVTDVLEVVGAILMLQWLLPAANASFCFRYGTVGRVCREVGRLRYAIRGLFLPAHIHRRTVNHSAKLLVHSWCHLFAKSRNSGGSVLSCVRLWRSPCKIDLLVGHVECCTRLFS